MFAKAVASNWRHFSVKVNGHFAPDFAALVVSRSLVCVTQWWIVHLCSGFDQNGNIVRLRSFSSIALRIPTAHKFTRD